MDFWNVTILGFGNGNLVIVLLPFFRFGPLRERREEATERTCLL
jgi:hypothetical protein